MLADLHIHSNFSDGSDNIEDLITVIINSNIKIFALTDHDTISGCQKMKEQVPSDIKFIPGVELTCSNPIDCHILGYNCNLENKTLNDLIEKGKRLRRIKLDKRIKYLDDKWGIVLNQQELDWLYTRQSVVKTHLANIIVNRGLADDNISAMKKYLDGCKTENTKFTTQEAVDAIVKSGGIPVWAHPLGGEGEKHSTKQEFFAKLDKMIPLGIKGLECYYSRYNADEIEFLKQCAIQNELLISGGSDYHGTNKTVQIVCLNNYGAQIDASELTILNKL